MIVDPELPDVDFLRAIGDSGIVEVVFGPLAVARRPRLPPMTDTFHYRADAKLAVFWLPFGVRPAKDGVTLTDDGRFVATFGWLKLETPLANVTGAHITSGYRWWTAVGARLSMQDDGLTFGTNADRGVCVHFREKVPSRLRRSGHSALTVTVADPEGLVAALESSGDPSGGATS